MASVRARLESGQTEFARVEFLKRRGSVPMCCFTSGKGPFGDFWLRCDQTKSALPEDLFAQFCWRCQREIAEKLGV